MKRLSLVLMIALLGFASAQEPIRIGVNLELSGRFTTIGNSTLQGIETAMSQLGTVLGRPIELSVCDNATTVEGSVACANRFADEGVVGVLGAISSSMSIPAAEVLQEAGVIMISTSSTNDATTQIGEYIFRMAYLDSFQGPTIARYAFNDLNASRAAVFRQQDDDYSVGLAGFMADAFVDLGGDVAFVDYVAGTADFSAQIADLRTYDADVVFFAGFCPEGAVLVPQLRQQGFDQQIIGADAIDDSQCPVGGGADFDGVIHTGFAPPELLEGETQQRAEDFRTVFNELFPDATDFNGFTLAGGDSYNVLVEAIRLAGSSDVVAVRDALAQLEGYPGVSGDVTFAGTDGSPIDRTIAFIEYRVRSSDDYEQVPIAAIRTVEDDE